MEKTEQQIAEQAEAEASWELFGDLLWEELHGKIQQQDGGREA